MKDYKSEIISGTFLEKGLLSYRVQSCNGVALAHGKMVGFGGMYVPQEIFYNLLSVTYIAKQLYKQCHC